MRGIRRGTHRLTLPVSLGFPRSLKLFQPLIARRSGSRAGAGPDDPRAIGVIRGAVRVARHLVYFWGPGATLVTHPAAGQPVLLGFVDRVLAGVLVLTVRGGKIQAVHVIGDPRQLSFVSSQLS